MPVFNLSHRHEFDKPDVEGPFEGQTAEIKDLVIVEAIYKYGIDLNRFQPSARAVSRALKAAVISPPRVI